MPLTLPSHTTILSGLLPPHHGLRNNGAGLLTPGTPTLATLLAAAGYRTAAFLGAFVLDHRFGLAGGFEVYDDEIPRDPKAGTVLEAERPGHDVMDRALAWLRTEGRRAPVLPLGPSLRRPRPLHTARGVGGEAPRPPLRRRGQQYVAAAAAAPDVTYF